MQPRQRWQDWVNLMVGAWLFLAPFIVFTAADGAAVWNSYLFGVLVVVFAFSALIRPQAWEEWVNLVIGVWLILAPFLLGFTDEVAMMWNHILVGVIIGADAIWAVLSRPSPAHA